MQTGRPDDSAWPAPRRGSEEPLVIELLDDVELDDADDVAFGVRGRRSDRGGARGPAEFGDEGDRPAGAGRRKGGLIAGGTIIGLVAVAGVVGAIRDDTSAPTTSVPATSIARPTTTRAQTTTTTELVFDVEPTDPPAVTEAPQPTVVDVGVDPLDTGGLPLGLFVSEGGDSREVHRIDLLSGLVSDFSNVIQPEFMVVPTGTGPVLIDGRSATGIWSAAPGPPGTVWVTGEGGYRQVDAATFDVLRTVPADGGPFGTGLIGSTGDGRPVVLGPDVRAYAINPDDSFSRLTENMVTDWQPGGVVESRCSEAMACSQWVRSELGEVDLGLEALTTSQRTTISGDGRLALTFPDGRPALVDLAAATTTLLFPDDESVRSFGFFGFFFGSGNSVADPWFGPDDRYVVFTSVGQQLIVWDTATSTARRWAIPTGWTDPRVLGIA